MKKNALMIVDNYPDVKHRVKRLLEDLKPIEHRKRFVEKIIHDITQKHHEALDQFWVDVKNSLVREGIVQASNELEDLELMLEGGVIYEVQESSEGFADTLSFLQAMVERLEQGEEDD